MKISLNIIPGFPSATKSLLPKSEIKTLSATIMAAKMGITKARYRLHLPPNYFKK